MAPMHTPSCTSEENNHVLRLFTDLNFLPEGVGHCQLLIPFFGTNDCPHDGYDDLERTGKQFLAISEAREAEYAVLPFDGSHLINTQCESKRHCQQLAKRFVQIASRHRLKTIVLVNSDLNCSIALPDTIVLRTSLNRRYRNTNEYALPAWHENLSRRVSGADQNRREFCTTPSIGFCGQVAMTKPKPTRRIKILLQRLVRAIGGYLDHNDGVHLRRAAIDFLRREADIQKNVIERHDYFGGALKNPAISDVVRTEYVDNLLNSDYALCIRGFGNFSFRFFEAMSLGRIPVLLDTQCGLPYDFLHDYSEYCLIVPEDRIRELPGMLLEFHRRFNAATFLEMQFKIGDFWQRWLSPQGFFRHLALILGRHASGSVRNEALDTGPIE